MLLSHNMMLHTLPRAHIDLCLLIYMNTVPANDIVLDQSQTRRTRSSWAQTTRMLECQELTQLCLGGFGEVNLTEVKDGVGVQGSDDIASDVGLLFSEDGEGVRHHGHRGNEEESRTRRVRVDKLKETKKSSPQSGPAVLYLRSVSLSTLGQTCADQ